MVKIRLLERSDLTELFVWRNDPAVTMHLARTEMSQEQLDAWFDSLGRAKGNLAYAIEYKGSFVGYGVIESIDDANRKCEVGVVLGKKSCWGKGGTASILISFCYRC